MEVVRCVVWERDRETYKGKRSFEDSSQSKHIQQIHAQHAVCDFLQFPQNTASQAEHCLRVCFDPLVNSMLKRFDEDQPEADKERSQHPLRHRQTSSRSLSQERIETQDVVHSAFDVGSWSRRDIFFKATTRGMYVLQNVGTRTDPSAPEPRTRLSRALNETSVSSPCCVFVFRSINISIGISSYNITPRHKFAASMSWCLSRIFTTD